MAESAFSSSEDAIKHGLTEEEFDWIKEFLGRVPNQLELYIFSVLWSEKFCHKNSLVWLKKLPRILNKSSRYSSFITYESHVLVLRHISSTEDFLPIGKRLALLGNSSINSFELPVRAENCDYAEGLFEVVLVDKDAPLESPKEDDVLILVKNSGNDFKEAISVLMEIEIVSGIHITGTEGLLPSLARLAASSGLEVNLDNLKTANIEKALSAKETALLLLVRKGKEESVISMLENYGSDSQIIGHSTDSAKLELFYNGKLKASVPSRELIFEAPVYYREYQEPSYFRPTQKLTYESLQLPENFIEIAEFLLQLPKINGNKHLLSEDDDVSDALVVPLDEDKCLALALTCNSRYVFANPEEGTAMLVSKAAREIVLSGGEPIGLSHCLTFGSPTNPEEYWQFVFSILGLKKASERFNTPILSGTADFLSPDRHATEPSIAMMGIIPDSGSRMTLSFKNTGDLIYLIGYSKDDYGSSAYLHEWLGLKESCPPYFNLNEEYNVQELLKGIIRNKLIESAHDVSEGGLFNALAECGIASGLGFKILSDFRYRKDAWLFGEKQSRAIVTVKMEKEGEFLKFVKGARNLLSREGNLGVEVIGTVTAHNFVVDNEIFMSVEKARVLYAKASQSISR